MSDLHRETRIDELELELDSLKSSRNYYKDQFEALLVSLSCSVQRETPSFRREDEVEDMVQSIRKHEKMKRNDLKMLMGSQKSEYEAAISNLEAKISEQTRLIQQQDEIRASLLEKLMHSKRELNQSRSLQEGAELTLRELQQSHERLDMDRIEMIESRNARMMEELKMSHADEIRVLKTHIAKLTKKLKQTRTSLEICTSAGNESNDKVNDLIVKLSAQQETEMRLRRELSGEHERAEQISRTLKLITEEMRSLQDEIDGSRNQIQTQARDLVLANSETEKLHTRLVLALEDADQSKSQARDAVREAVELRLKIDEMQSERKRTQRLAEERIRDMTSHNEKLQSHIESLNSSIREQRVSSERIQRQMDQEVRVRKTAEFERDTAMMNMKNAYSLLGSSPPRSPIAAESRTGFYPSVESPVRSPSAGHQIGYFRSPTHTSPPDYSSYAAASARRDYRTQRSEQVTESKIDLDDAPSGAIEQSNLRSETSERITVLRSGSVHSEETSQAQTTDLLASAPSTDLGRQPPAVKSRRSALAESLALLERLSNAP
jgi:chromosome segregation ATPase